MTGPTTRRRWWLLCLAGLVFATSVGLWQSRSIQQFRRPEVGQVLRTGERAVFDGVAYQLKAFTHAPELPIKPELRDLRDADVVRALSGAELVQVVLTVERIDPGRRPDTVFCDLTLEDPSGRVWRSDSSVEYDVDGPEASTCGGVEESGPRVGRPFDVGQVFQVPADGVDRVTGRLRLSGGQGRLLLELQPR